MLNAKDPLYTDWSIHLASHLLWMSLYLPISIEKPLCLYVVICFYIHRWSCVPLSPAQLGPLGHFHRHRWRQPGENHRKNWGKPQIGGTKHWKVNISWMFGVPNMYQEWFFGGPQVSENWISARRNGFVSKWIMSHKTAMQNLQKYGEWGRFQFLTHPQLNVYASKFQANANCWFWATSRSKVSISPKLDTYPNTGILMIQLLFLKDGPKP